MATQRPSLTILQITTIIAVVLIVVAVILWNINAPDVTSDTSSNSGPVTTDQPETAPIESSSDLQHAEDTLEDIDLEELDTAELDSLEDELL